MMGCCCSRSWCMVAGVIHQLSNFSRCYVRNMPSSPESIPPQTSSILLSSSMPCGPACKDLKKVSAASGKQVWCGHLQITGHNRGASCHCKQFKTFRLIRVCWLFCSSLRWTQLFKHGIYFSNYSLYILAIPYRSIRFL